MLLDLLFDGAEADETMKAKQLELDRLADSGYTRQWIALLLWKEASHDTLGGRTTERTASELDSSQESPRATKPCVMSSRRDNSSIGRIIDNLILKKSYFHVNEHTKSVTGTHRPNGWISRLRWGSTVLWPPAKMHGWRRAEHAG